MRRQACPHVSNAAIALATILWLLASPSARAWEADLHEGLTRWLALQAGAKPDVAVQLGTWDQDLDEGAHSAVDTVFHYACVANDAGMSRTVREDHFPSTAPIPGSPASRAVRAASPAAKHRAEDRLKNPGTDLRYEIELFGNALHALQDSWSHEGIPDIPQFGPLRCSRELAWGHPQTRHGWLKHDADLTYLWPAKTTVDTARATFDYIVAFLNEHRQLRNGLPRPWKDFSSSIDGFRTAATKAEKRRWFVQQGISDTSFLNGISLDEGDEIFAVPRHPRRVAAKYQPKAPRDVASFYLSFFKDWAFTYDFGALAATYIDTPSMARALAASTAGVEASPQLVVQSLRLWRMRDHGKVAALDHIPRIGATTPAMTALADDRQLVQYTSLQDAYISLTGDPEIPYLIEPAGTSPTRFVALARFANAPYDTIAVVADTLQGRLRIVDLLFAIDH